jgi:hypothetical protein
MENVGIFMDIWNILRPFRIFRGNLGYFSHFGMLHQEKSGNPASRGRLLRLRISSYY